MTDEPDCRRCGEQMLALVNAYMASTYAYVCTNRGCRLAGRAFQSWKYRE